MTSSSIDEVKEKHRFSHLHLSFTVAAKRQQRGEGFLRLCCEKTYTLYIWFCRGRAFHPSSIVGIVIGRMAREPQAVLMQFRPFGGCRIAKKRLFEKSFQHAPFLYVYHFITALYATFRARHLTPLIDRLFCGFWRLRN